MHMKIFHENINLRKINKLDIYNILNVNVLLILLMRCNTPDVEGEDGAMVQVRRRVVPMVLWVERDLKLLAAVLPCYS